MSLDTSRIALEADQEWCFKNGVHVTWPGQWDYPEAFMKLICRPGVIFYLGQPVWLTHQLISVVGSRAPQASSLTWLDDTLSAVLAEKNIGVVSGGARGIDQKAHQVAIRAERPTVAFLPSGLKEIYPYTFKDWRPSILETGGCLVSQFQPSMPMRKGSFRARNMLIAAISELTLIVECRRRSGTMLTAGFCVDLEKKIIVMPTFPGEAGLGGLDLICDQCALIARDKTDLILALGHAPILNRGID